MAQFIHLEWLTRNSLRSFPLQENCTGTAPSGFRLPNDLLVDASLCVPSAPSGVYLSALCVSPHLLTLVFSCVSTGATLATATAIRGTTPVWSRQPVNPAANGVGGFVSFGPRLNTWFEIFGSQTFDISNVLSSRCVLQTGVFPITSLSALRYPTISGYVSLQTGGSMQLAQTSGTDTDGVPLTYLTFSLTDTSDFTPVCSPPASTLLCRKNPILSINGVVPDGAGNIQVEFVGFSSTSQMGNLLNALFLAAGNAYCGSVVAPPG